MAGRKYTFVSVFFEAEYDLLRLQAHSFDRYCPDELVDSILVIDNGHRPQPPARRARLRHDFGRLADRLRFVDAADIAHMPGWGGWYSQQVLKLKIAADIATDRYVVIDAKNHLVAPLQRDFLEAADGRARLPAHGYRNHSLRPSLENVLDHFGLDRTKHVERFAHTVTPFVLYTELVRRLMIETVGETGLPFEIVFLKHRFLEFFLYVGYIIASGNDVESLYDFSLPSCPMIWLPAPDYETCKAAISLSGDSGLPFFSVHRRSFGGLDRECRGLLADFWHERGLFPSKDAGRRFIRQVHWRDRATWLASLPRKGAHFVSRIGLTDEARNERLAERTLASRARFPQRRAP